MMQIIDVALPVAIKALVQYRETLRSNHQDHVPDTVVTPITVNVKQASVAKPKPRVSKPKKMTTKRKPSTNNSSAKAKQKKK